EGGAIAFFQTGGLALAIYPFDKLAEDCGMTDRGPGFGGFTIAYNTFSQEEVDDVLARAVAAGGKLQKAAHKAFWGGYSGYFLDPDGHPWEVAWNPFFMLTQDGEMLLPEQ
ncbi:MAG: VOC family protein, partial [Pseudomonadota bacterium]